MKRSDATDQVLAAKQAKGLSFTEIAENLGRHPIWVATAFYGQATMSADEAQKTVELLDLGDDVALALQEIPYRGALDQPVPVDPLLYRLYEIIQVYGPGIKAIIHEKFGDGIMSAIDFDIDIQKEANPKGDRIVLTMNGKYLQYKKW